ncbi:GNAT family N-acetyltransferase [Actibacterium sp. 188UL27-1]|uniref:GNAT family N-acetyltransferase n=1 Tax=Actibacterium sp. 188UL27-1 TaxID=2786961 RepID=UPI00195A2739|nr:GNAT family N-acetyltransferase [Actibacterium sp. 188UL27-1]MBM7066238.1 GNAT family N-acetyltransferase [Actibacterium sp. 188UL27-1]
MTRAATSSSAFASATVSANVSIPLLETARLVLRAPTTGDFEPYAQVLASPRARFLNGPYDRNAAWKDYCLSVAEWVLHGIGPLAIDEGDRFAGLVGISRHPDFPEPELGWVLTAEAEGQGIAFEAANAMRDWASRAQGLSALVSYMWPGNDRATRLARRLGGQQDLDAAKPWPGALVYRYDTSQSAVA